MFPFQSLFPFKDIMQQLMKHSGHSSSIEKFVQESISKSMSSSLDLFQNNASVIQRAFHENQVSEDGEVSLPEQTKASELTPTIFDSHDHVYVKFRIKDSTKLSNVKIFHTSNTIIIEGYPNEESYHEFALPEIVKKKGATTSYKDEYLQIKLPKATDMQYTQIDVPPID
ncbi:Hsp20/alpha crystallin family protein [Bacillus timonensis]|uniref:Hsp20/alpha crystallin family protein n=1 Tax=Bacillus timonensis TaxID=1033734 RepID=UPI00028814E3|nr:Hsp20/alpha crystallin family protein [Bacillus timonensis]